MEPSTDKEAEQSPPAHADDNHTDPVFYYSREHRLNQASQVVRSMNEEKPARRGILGSLFGSRANISFFFTIILICLVLVLGSRLSARTPGIKLGGNTVAMAVQRSDGLPVLVISKKAPDSGVSYVGAVDVAVFPAETESDGAKGSDGLTHRIFFNPAGSETYRIPLPFGGNDFFVTLRAEDEQKSVRLKLR